MYVFLCNNGLKNSKTLLIPYFKSHFIIIINSYVIEPTITFILNNDDFILIALSTMCNFFYKKSCYFYIFSFKYFLNILYENKAYILNKAKKIPKIG